jgi:hypothetical protein
MADMGLDQLIRQNILAADSAVFENPRIELYLDKTVPRRDVESKIGNYPHQLLKKADALIRVKNVRFRNASIAFIEKSGKTGREAKVYVNNGTMLAHNVTNDSLLILQNNIGTASIEGNILGSPGKLMFRFYLDDSLGRFEASGRIKNIGSRQINALTLPLANVDVNNLYIRSLDFDIRGEDMSATGNVAMQYQGLSVKFLETDTVTGRTTEKKFITRLLNRFVLVPSNPDQKGERRSVNRKVLRLTTQSFFGLIWKTIYDGMQFIAMGRSNPQ